MSDHLLYAQIVPETAQTRATNTHEQRLAVQSAIDSSSNVKVLGGEPGERQLKVQYRGHAADRLARQLDALFNNSKMGEVPYYGVDSTGAHTSSPEDGYYALSSTDSGFPDPRLKNLPYAEGRLKPVGSRKSHFRAVSTAPYTPANGNPFGSGTTKQFGVPPNIRRARWWSRDPHDTEPAAPSVAGKATGWGEVVDVYDTDDSTFTDPTLVFDCPYEDEAKLDPVIWDTLGYASKTQTIDGDTVRNWEHVYETGHEAEGDHTLSNGVVRYDFDEDAESLAVEQWDSVNSTWSAVSLGASSWHFLDLDIREVSQQRVWGYSWWTDDSSEYPFRFTFQTGADWMQFHVPDFKSSGPPTGLTDLLDPVASTQAPITNAEKGLVERTRVTPS